jgi:protein ImuB
MLPIDLLRRREARRHARFGQAADRRALVMSRSDGARSIVGAACPRARALGARVGAPLKDVQAAIGPDKVRTVPMTPEHDLASLRALALWASRFSPRVAIDGPDGLMLDASGLTHVFTSEARLLQRIEQELAQLGLCSRLAIAPSNACAWALARYHRAGPSDALGKSAQRAHPIVPAGGEAAALAPLPAAALQIEPCVLTALGELGIEKIEQVMHLPRHALPSRFGELLIHRLDLALSRQIETMVPIRPSEPMRAECRFDGPSTNTESVQLAARKVLESVCDNARAIGAGLTRVRIELARVDLPVEPLMVNLSRATDDARHIWSLVKPRAEKIHLGFGVEGVSAEVLRLGRIDQQQLPIDTMHAIAFDAFQSEQSQPRVLGALCDTLISRLGRDRVRQAELLEAHIPERAARYVPVDAEPHAWLQPGSAWLDARDAERDRPSVLLEPPVPVNATALVPDGPIARVQWRGQDLLIDACVGPERMSEAWWLRRHDGPESQDAARERGQDTREYFAARDQHGQWWWVYRRLSDGQWFIAGHW